MHKLEELRMDSNVSPQIIPPLKFAVLSNGTIFQHWQADAIRKLITGGHQLVLLIRDDREYVPGSLLPKLRKYTGPRSLFNLLNRFFCHPASWKPVDLQSELNNIEVLSSIVEKRGHAEYFDPGDIEKIESYNLDFILRFGFNILRGPILTSAKYGIWSFHHDDEQKYRGGPPGFWEVYYRDPVNAAMMQRLTDKLDNGIILKKGFLRTVRHSYSGNLDQLLRTSSSWPLLVANDIVRRGYNPEPWLDSSAPVYKIPGNISMILFLCRLLWSKLIFHYWDLFRPEVWNVGIVKRPIYEIALGNPEIRNEDVTWLREISSISYLADPAGFEEDNKMHILVEDFNYVKRSASISEVIWDQPRNSFSVPIRIIEGKNHLSYPFIVQYQKVIYCVPESFTEGNIELYKRNFSEEDFVEDQILLKNVNAVDPTLINFDNRWWLFFTVKEYSRSHLYIYFSNQFFGTYKPHPMNPVKIDVRSARPAGTPFIYDGVLYRPAQDCSITYGGRVIINKVTRLTTEEFEETFVRFIEPVKCSHYSKGLHTLSAVGNHTLIDGKNFRFNWYHFTHRFNFKIDRTLKRDA